MDKLTNWRRDSAEGLSAATIERLRVYEDLLRKWQPKINLVSESTLADVWNRHFLDSFQLLALAGAWTRWVDLGSGAGFPGMVVAIANADPRRKVHLIEADKRKVAFLREVSRETKAPVEIHCGRVEAMLPGLCHRERFDIVSARGLAPLVDLFRLAAPALKSGALGMFLKGKDFATELTNLGALSNFECSVVVSQSDPCARVVLLRWNEPTVIRI
jgi:16S rRNA (guanine527-N7)-methyltransferase